MKPQFSLVRPVYIFLFACHKPDDILLLVNGKAIELDVLKIQLIR